MSNKQSSVEWLIGELADLTFNYIAGFLTKQEYDAQSILLIEKSKAMHKTEHFNTWWHGISENEPITFDQFYKETFEGGNK